MKPITKEKIGLRTYIYGCAACSAKWEKKTEAETCCNEIEVSE